MPRDTRLFIRVHEGMPDHPKIEGLSDAAFRLLVTTWCWSSRQRTDGLVPAASWAKRGTPKARRELAAAGLVEVLDGGDVQVHDYLEWQRSAAEIEALTENRRAAGARGGKARASRQASAKQVLEQTASTPQPETETDPATDVAGREPAKKPPRARSQRKQRLPDGFELTDGMRRWAAENVPGIDVDREFAKFADHHVAHGSVMADWTRAWHTWMRRAEEYNHRPAAASGGAIRSTTDARVQAGMALAERFASEEGLLP